MLAIIPFILLQIQTPAPLDVDPPRRDFGECKAGTMLRGECRLKNTASSAIEITNVATVCGCQQPRLDKKTVAAGETASLVFTINTITQPVGANQWKATVEYRQEGERHSADIFLFAKISREIDISPVQIAGTFENSFETSITLHDRRAKPHPVRKVATGLGILEAVVEPMTADGRQVVKLKTKPDVPFGDYSDVVHLDIADADYPELKVPIRLSKAPPASVSIHPEKLTLRWTGGQATASGMFVLRSKEDGKAFEIDKVETDSAALKTKFAVADGVGSVRVTLDTQGQQTGETEVRIHLRDAAKTVLKVPVRWEAPSVKATDR